METVACALCEVTETANVFHPPHSPGPVVQCQRCGLVYVSPRMDTRALIYDGPVRDSEATPSDDAPYLENSWELDILRTKRAEFPALQRNAELALGRMERFVRPPGKILDFGCGGGFFLSCAKDRGWQTYGLEPLPGHAIYGRTEFDLDIVCDTLREDSYDNDFFDVITAFQVFEHLPDPVDNLRKLTTFLKPGGLVLIEVPRIDTAMVKLLGKRHRHFVQDHLYFFSGATLSQMMAQCGLETVDTYYPSRLMTLNHLSSRWLKGKVPLHKVKGIKDLILPMNLRDIVAVIGRKPGSDSTNRNGIL